MITLVQLRNLANEVFPGQSADLVHLLIAWADKDPEKQLASVLQDCGMDTAGMATVLRKLLRKASGDDALSSIDLNLWNR